MSFTRVKTLGWALFETLTSAQMNSLDLDHADAIDGVNGGSYSPSADIEFPGANSIEWGATRWPKLTTRTVVYWQGLSLSDALTADYGWNAVIGHGIDQNAFAGFSIGFQCNRLPPQGTITKVGARCSNTGGGTTPTTKPQITLLEHLEDASAPTSYGNQIYPGTYGSGVDQFDMETTTVSRSFDHSSARTKFTILVKGEADGNNTAGRFHILSTWAEVTIDALRG